LGTVLVKSKFTVSVKHGKSVDIEKNNNNIASVEIFGIFQENELINVGNLHKIFIINNESEIDRNTSDLYNKNYAQIIAQERLKITTIERGSGETLACGSGICASVFYIIRNKLTTSNTIQIETKGTKLMNDEFSIQDEITFVNYVCSKGVQHVCAPVAAKSDGAFVKVDGDLIFCVFNWAKGEPLNFMEFRFMLDETVVTAWGKFFAEFHASSKQFSIEHVFSVQVRLS
jgi:hypothetical protein